MIYFEEAFKAIHLIFDKLPDPKGFNPMDEIIVHNKDLRLITIYVLSNKHVWHEMIHQNYSPEEDTKIAQYIEKAKK